MNRTGAPHGDILGLINPISRRSFNCSVNFLSFSGAILYGRIEMGWVSGKRSILKSISLSRETPERSSRNASGNSHATDTDSRVGGHHDVPQLRWLTDNWQKETGKTLRHEGIAVPLSNAILAYGMMRHYHAGSLEINTWEIHPLRNAPISWRTSRMGQLGIYTSPRRAMGPYDGVLRLERSVQCMPNTRSSGQPLFPINAEPQLIGRMDAQRDIERRVAQ
ncbi:hypothetical protein CQW23_13975 [Capsicum baccatum]|uniref:Uncharacterized protein n=1 Tax=Capsicum baccatum TaxID=33114 RepID=A0A2G2WHT6_CAPBA|nr:hypothetical protein CQW23_13975 [Capsicum baccatum]